MKDFLKQDHKALTVMGMSGVGKTWLAAMLAENGWFHYSVDYRIGAHYLDQAIVDDLRAQVDNIPRIHDLLESDSIRIRNHITFGNLRPLSAWLGRPGNPESGGMAVKEFKHRQQLHRDAEISAMHDVSAFIEKGREKGCQHFLCDASGSLCELEDEDMLAELASQTLILYIKATKKDEEELFRRALAHPKPLYYPKAFLESALTEYMTENNLDYVALIEPDDFFRWVFPKLFYARLPKYRDIADRYGYTITTEELRSVKDESDFLSLLAKAIERKN